MIKFQGAIFLVSFESKLILMKVLMINHEFPPVGGGGGQAAFNISRELVRMGLDVFVLTSKFNGAKDRETIDGIKVMRVPVARRRISFTSTPEMLTFILSAFPTLVNVLRKKRIDIIHTFFGLPSGVLSFLAKKIFAVPYIIRMGGSDVPGFNPYRLKVSLKAFTPFLLRIWQDAAILIAVSHGLRSLALKADPGANILVIPNGVDTQKFRPVPILNRMENNILFVGRLASQRKGVQFLLQAVRKLNEENLPCRLTVIGTGPHKPRLEKMTRDLNLKNVKFLGYVPNERLPTYYNEADVFALPSSSEGMSNVILEAMACGLPVVATNVGGNPELVDDGKTGLLVPPENADALYDAFLQLLLGKEKGKKMGMLGRKKIKHFFTWNRIAMEYLQLYEAILSNTSATHNRSR